MILQHHGLTPKPTSSLGLQKPRRPPRLTAEHMAQVSVYEFLVASHTPLPQYLPVPVLPQSAQPVLPLSGFSPRASSQMPLLLQVGQAPQSPGQVLHFSPNRVSHTPLPQLQKVTWKWGGGVQVLRPWLGRTCQAAVLRTRLYHQCRHDDDDAVPHCWCTSHGSVAIRLYAAQRSTGSGPLLAVTARQGKAAHQAPQSPGQEEHVSPPLHLPSPQNVHAPQSAAQLKHL